MRYLERRNAMLKSYTITQKLFSHHIFSAACICCFVTSASAQPQSTPSSEHFCASLPTYDEQSFIPFLDAMIIPGKRLSFSELEKTLPPETMSKIIGLDEARAEQEAKDWPNLCRYTTKNAKILSNGKRPDVVFIGDSITEIWTRGDPSLFNDRSVNRGIGDQTTSQLLLRFYQDVVSLRPRVVHIMAGTNDISPETLSAEDATTVNNIRAMIDIAKANGIRVIVASVTPSKGFYMQPNFDPSTRISAVNRELVRLAATQRVIHVNYFPKLVDSVGDFNAALSNDGLHPNRDGYAVMRPLLEQAIRRAKR